MSAGWFEQCIAFLVMSAQKSNIRLKALITIKVLN